MRVPDGFDAGRVLLCPVHDVLATALTIGGVSCQPIGPSAEGRDLFAYATGDPALPLVSIVAGAHPDEPAGPVAALELLRGWAQEPLSRRVRLAVVPLIDIDGTVAQDAWLRPWTGAVDLARYFEHRLRRPPGEDREFAWPGAPWGGTVLPECAAAARFLDAQGPAIAHLSLHGMFAALGPWYLLDRRALTDARLWRELRTAAEALDLPLHEFHRYGDKGFRRVGRGFCTTPSGPEMRRHFLRRGEAATAAGFGYGSMDAARARSAGADQPIVAVSEFPLLQLPETDPATLRREREAVEAAVAAGEFAAAAQRLLAAGCRPVPLDDQVAGMLTMVRAVIRSALRRTGDAPEPADCS